MFPNVKEGHIVLMRAEISTGKVLDINNKHALTPDQVIYSVCENMESALKLGKSIVQGNRNVECYIYNANEILKYKLTIYELESF